MAEWESEINQFFSFVEKWKTNTGYTDLPALPFDPTKEVNGGRAPCLEGQKNLLKAMKATAKDYDWRYDASSSGNLQIWPNKKEGVWDFPLQLLPYEGGKFQGLSMDFNFLANQSGDSPRATRPSTPSGSRRPSRRTWTVSTACTTAVAHRCSSATTSRTGTVAST